MCSEQFEASFLNFHEDQVLVVLAGWGKRGSTESLGNGELERVGQRQEVKLVLVQRMNKTEDDERTEHFSTDVAAVEEWTKSVFQGL